MKRLPTEELGNSLKIFADDIDQSAGFNSEVSIINTICKDGNPAHFHNVLSILKVLSTNKKLLIKNVITTPVDTGRKLNVHKTFRRRPGRLLNVLCTFSLRPVSIGTVKIMLVNGATTATPERSLSMTRNIKI